jgi:hypothetical protein
MTEAQIAPAYLRRHGEFDPDPSTTALREQAPRVVGMVPGWVQRGEGSSGGGPQGVGRRPRRWRWRLFGLLWYSKGIWSIGIGSPVDLRLAATISTKGRGPGPRPIHSSRVVSMSAHGWATVTMTSSCSEGLIKVSRLARTG